jgi:hypothetical protein
MLLLTLNRQVCTNSVVVCAKYCLDPGPEPKLKPKHFISRNRNRNLSTVGTGTGIVKNSYGSATLDRGPIWILSELTAKFHKKNAAKAGSETKKALAYL